MERPERVLAATLAGVIVLRVVLAAWLPITGDEAYFWFWGKRPDLGFYDHPPMIGWWLALVQPLGDSRFVARLPALLLPVFVALAVLSLARPAGRERAHLAAIATLLVPAEWLNVLVSTDTPLVFFALASVLAYARAIERRAAVNGWHVAAGLLLGCALLSKYFAGLLAIGYVAFAAVSPRHERRWPGLVVLAICSVPPVLVNLWWNYGHCWSNIMFNLYNRHGGAGASLRTPLLYAATLLYVTTPILWWQLARGRAGNDYREADHPRRRLIACAAGVPLALFALLSIPKTIGLHWLLAFVPLVFAAAAFRLTAPQLVLNIKLLALISALHLAVLATFAIAPIETWQRARVYDSLVLTARPKALIDALRPYEALQWATDGYSNAVTLGFNARRYVAVFGQASSHARHDDILTDWSKLGGRDVLVLRKEPAPREDYEPYFASVEYRDVTVHGATFHLVIGRGFRFEPYRDQVLAAVRDKYYRIPSFLPQRACYFCERYFDVSACPVR